MKEHANETPNLMRKNNHLIIVVFHKLEPLELARHLWYVLKIFRLGAYLQFVILGSASMVLGPPNKYNVEKEEEKSLNRRWVGQGTGRLQPHLWRLAGSLAGELY